MKGFKIVLLLLGLLLYVIPSAYGVSISCMMVYDEGSAPAIFQSPECPDWVLSTKFLRNETMNCQFATSQGRRKYQEDRISCNLDMKIPFLGNNETEEVRVGVVAVFDGHIGKEASEMASKLFLDYFYLHSVFGTYKERLLLEEDNLMVCEEHHEPQEPERHTSINRSSKGLLHGRCDESKHMGILKEALVRTIHDIDITFTKEALKNDLASGTTAVIVLLVNGQILVANVGDSKALLCSQNIQSRHEDKGTFMAHLFAKELTRDHNADRVEERARIEAAGGVIFQWDVPLVNGHFPMTRAIGDVPLKRYGIISMPEVTDWQPLTVKDYYLVVASDGIFESFTPQNVCDLLQDAQSKGYEKSAHSSSCLSSSSVTDCIVRRAFEEGSTDNLSVVVVPLGAPFLRKFDYGVASTI